MFLFLLFFFFFFGGGGVICFVCFVYLLHHTESEIDAIIGSLLQHFKMHW